MRYASERRKKSICDWTLIRTFFDSLDGSAEFLVKQGLIGKVVSIRSSSSSHRFASVSLNNTVLRLTNLFYFRQDYPTKPPKVKFAKPLFHPNVYPCGKICLDIINDDSASKWTAAITLKQVNRGVFNTRVSMSVPPYFLFLKGPCGNSRPP